MLAQATSGRDLVQIMVALELSTTGMDFQHGLKRIQAVQVAFSDGLNVNGGNLLAGQAVQHPSMLH